MGTIEDVKLRILSILVKFGEMNATTLEKVADCSNKTFLKARQELEKDGFIVKRYEKRSGGGLYAFYSITDEGRKYYEKERLKVDFADIVDKADLNRVEKLKRMLEAMRRELEHYKRLDEIHELEELPLPLVVLKKMFGEEQARNFKNVFEDRRGVDDLPPELRELEVKTVSADEFFRHYTGPQWKVLKEDLKRIEERRGNATLYRYEGTVTIGMYKRLFRLYEEEFEYEWLKWKEEFNLSDEDWKMIGPYIAYDMLSEAGRIDLPIMISNSLYNYVLSKKPNAVEELKKCFIQVFQCNEDYAEKMARETLEFFNELRRKTVEEVWREVEREVSHLDEVSQQIFKYIKTKYGR